MSTMIDDPRLIKSDKQGGLMATLRRTLAVSDLGMLPVILGLLVIWTIFAIANPNFLSPSNLTNLMLQNVAVGILSVGVILVLLLGEIDLSIGAVSGLCAAIMAVLNQKMGWPGWLAIIAGLLVGLAIGLFQGTWFAKFRVPSFIVTLAGLLAWQGALLLVLGNTGTINLRDPSITSLTKTFFDPLQGWIIGAAAVALYAAVAFAGRRRRQASGLTTIPLSALIIRLVLLALLVFVSIAVFNADRGLPIAVVIFIGIIMLFDFITKRTLFGRHIYAVGGNVEAARRASINVDGIRIVVFGLCSLLAATGGIMGASRLLAVNQSSGSGDLLLNAIAGAVIGGTSLFGGRGTVWAALLGALVIGSISNGMDLLAFESSIKFMITGGVLLLAVTLDALARRRRQAAGR